MGRPNNTVPKFSIDKSGRAFTKIAGRFISLGRGDSPDAKLRYAKLLEDHARGVLTNTAKKPPASRQTVTVAELLLLFASKELPRYSEAERHCFASSIRLLRELFGDTPIVEFGPLRLRVVRDAMIAGNPDAKPKPRTPWSRKTVNHQVKRLQAIFRWGVSFEIVPAEVATGLGTLRHLRRGETVAAESKPRTAIDADTIEAARVQLKPLYRDVFDLMLLTGARPGEILSLTTGMLDRTGDEWVCELLDHKNRHKEKARYLVFGLSAQRILLRQLKADPDAKLFPCRRDNFAQAVKVACGRANVPPFSPHLLRHTAGTQVVERLGIADAQALLGHASAAMTEHYSRAAIEPAKRAARALDTDVKVIG
ncbi:MAG: tyrosine-type recombinase/integrase [Planctomycetaceae bacterium]